MPLTPPPAAQGEVTMMTYEEWEELEKATSPDGPPPPETYPESADGEPDQAAPPPLPVIQIKNGELSSLATRAEEMLIAAGVPIYQRGGALVRPIIETVDATRGRKTNICQLKILDTVYARDLLGRHAVWEKWDARARRDVPVNPPGDIAATMLARAGDWMFPVITGVISAPTMRPDGSLLLDPGYDAATRLLLVEPPAMPAIADHPTRQDAEAALKLIEGLLTGFPSSTTSPGRWRCPRS
jgi:hypothetical protein